MHSMDNYYVSKLLPLIAEAGVAAVANPLINIVLQGRHDSYPKRRGQTRVPEMRTHGIDVAFGQDCCMDPWYSLGSADMLEVAHMGLHVGQMTSRDAMRFCFDAVTANPAKIMGLDGYGLDVGCHGDLVLLQARDPIEAIRLKATRLAVIRRGKVIAETPARIGKLALDGRPASVDPAAYAPSSAAVSPAHWPRSSCRNCRASARSPCWIATAPSDAASPIRRGRRGTASTSPPTRWAASAPMTTALSTG
jgi:cytosine deaminase